AFAGALGAILLVFVFGRARGHLVPHLALLAGVVVNALCGALLMALRTLAAQHTLGESMSWLMGALGSVDSARLAALFAYAGAARLTFVLIGSEPAVGVLTALVGAPLFLVILRKRGTERL